MPDCTADSANRRIRIWIHTTSSQQAPARKYSAKDQAIHGVLNGRWASLAMYQPVRGWMTIVVVVNSQSARTTWRTTEAATSGLRPRLASSM